MLTTVLVVWVTFISHGCSAPLPAETGHTTKHNHVHKHKLNHAASNELKVNAPNHHHARTHHYCLHCKRCCTKREQLVGCEDLHKMITELKTRINAREQLKKAEEALKSESVCKDKQPCEKEKDESCGGCCGDENGNCNCCDDDCDDCNDNCECNNNNNNDCCNDNGCNCNPDCDECESDNDDDNDCNDGCDNCNDCNSECECADAGEHDPRAPSEDKTTKSDIDSHEHHHYHHHCPCCIAVCHQHVNYHDHDHHHQHCHCMGCPCQYTNYKCTPINKDGGKGGAGECCGGMQRDATANVTAALNQTVNSNITSAADAAAADMVSANGVDGAAADAAAADMVSANGADSAADGVAPAEKANNLLACTSIHHMIDELKGEINAKSNAAAASNGAQNKEKTGGARCIINKCLCACKELKKSHHNHHKRRNHKIKKFLGNKNKKTVRKVLTQFLSSWLHPANKTKHVVH